MQASIYIGSLPLILEDWQETEGGKGSLDAARGTILCPAVNWRAALESIGYLRNQKLPADLGYHSMWINDFIPGARSGETIEIGVNCLGLIAPEEKRKITITGSEKRFSVGPDAPMPGGLRDSAGNLVKQTMDGWFVNDSGDIVPRELYPRIIYGSSEGDSRPAHSIGMPSMVCTTTYFSTIQPDAGDVARVMTPPALSIQSLEFTPIQAEFMNLRANTPHGWILTSRNVEILFEDGVLQGSEGVGGLSGLFATTDVFTYYLNEEPI